jgi:hypothetical protein
MQTRRVNTLTPCPDSDDGQHHYRYDGDPTRERIEPYGIVGLGAQVQLIVYCCVCGKVAIVRLKQALGREWAEIMEFADGE